MLQLPIYGVIDGQHRVAAVRALQSKPKPKYGTHVALPVVVRVGDMSDLEAKMLGMGTNREGQEKLALTFADELYAVCVCIVVFLFCNRLLSLCYI